MEKKNKNLNEKISTFFRCKQCLTIQKIVKIILSRYNRPMTSIYIFTICQNEHFEKYKLKSISELNQFNLEETKCSSCKNSIPIYYCLTCYKIFCPKCKDEHSIKFHNKIIELENIDNICPKHFPYKPNEKYIPFYICEKCQKGHSIDVSESDFNEIKEEFDENIKQIKNDLNEIYKQYKNNEYVETLIKSFKNRINEEINFIKLYYEQSQNILKSNSKLNINIFRNLSSFQTKNPLKQIFINKDLEEIDILHIFSLEHLFKSYNSFDELNLKIIKLLKINEEEKNHCEASPEKYNHIRSLVDYPIKGKFDIFTNKNKIPIIVFSKDNKIYFMNLVNFAIENCIANEEELNVYELKYYKFNNNEYILSLLKNENCEKINIYDMNNNFEIKYSIKNDEDDNEIHNGLLFYYQNNLMIFICLAENVSIYNINNKELITSIYNYNTFGEDFIYVDKNNSCYIVLNSKEKMLSLKYPKCQFYREYPNYFKEYGYYTYPKIVEFENNITYLFAIFGNDFLYIFDFHTSELVKEIDIIVSWPVSSSEYIFWNSDTVLIPNGNDDFSLVVNISTEDVGNYLPHSLQMKKVYLPNYKECIITEQMLSGIHLYSLEMHFLSEEEMKKNEEKKEKEKEEKKDSYDDKEKKDSYNDKLLNKFIISYEQSLNKSSKNIFIWFWFFIFSLSAIFLSIIIYKKWLKF